VPPPDEGDDEMTFFPEADGFAFPAADETFSALPVAIEKAKTASSSLEGKYVIFFDLETTGFPQRTTTPGGYPPYSKIAAYESARIVQISFMLCNASDLSQVDFKNIIIRSDGFDIPNGDFHGVTLERSLAEGTDFTQAVLGEIEPSFQRADYLIAHNSEYDINVLKSEWFRYGFNPLLNHIEGLSVICSMKKTRSIVRALDSRSRLKNPKLAELYEFATNNAIENAHDAKYDVINLHEAIKTLVDNKVLVDIFK